MKSVALIFCITAALFVFGVIYRIGAEVESRVVRIMGVIGIFIALCVAVIIFAPSLLEVF